MTSDYGTVAKPCSFPMGPMFTVPLTDRTREPIEDWLRREHGLDAGSISDRLPQAAPRFTLFGAPPWDPQATVRGYWVDWPAIDSARCAGELDSGPWLPDEGPAFGDLFLVVDASDDLAAGLFKWHDDTSGGWWSEIWSTL